MGMKKFYSTEIYLGSAETLMIENNNKKNRNRTPWYDPAEAASPAVHRLKEAMFHAAVVTDIENDPLPPPHPELTQFFERPKRVVTRSKKAAEDCKKVFKITKGTSFSFT